MGDSHFKMFYWTGHGGEDIMVLHTGDDHSQMNPEIIPISFGETVLREEKQLVDLSYAALAHSFFLLFHG
jgi:hypothetical protein